MLVIQPSSASRSAQGRWLTRNVPIMLRSTTSQCSGDGVDVGEGHRHRPPRCSPGRRAAPTGRRGHQRRAGGRIADVALHVHGVGQLVRHPFPRLDRCLELTTMPAPRAAKRRRGLTDAADDPVTMTASPTDPCPAPLVACSVPGPAAHPRPGDGRWNVARAERCEAGAGRDQLVDLVEQLVVEHHVGGTELAVEVLGGGGPMMAAVTAGWFITKARATWTRVMSRSSASLARPSAATSLAWLAGSERS